MKGTLNIFLLEKNKNSELWWSFTTMLIQLNWTEGIPPPHLYFSNPSCLAPLVRFFQKSTVNKDSYATDLLWKCTSANHRKQGKDGEEAKQRYDFRRNPIEPHRQTLHHSLASNQGSWDFVSPFPLLHHYCLWGGELTNPKPFDLPAFWGWLQCPLLKVTGVSH